MLGSIVQNMFIDLVGHGHHAPFQAEIGDEGFPGGSGGLLESFALSGETLEGDPDDEFVGADL